MSEFAPPANKLATIGVTAAPTGGQGLALNDKGKLPARVLPSVTPTWPSGTPDPGEEIVYQAALGVLWRFKYQPDQDATFPWMFIGGGDMNVVTDTASTLGTGQMGPNFTVPRGGLYSISFFVEWDNVANPAIAFKWSCSLGDTTIGTYGTPWEIVAWDVAPAAATIGWVQSHGPRNGQLIAGRVLTLVGAFVNLDSNTRTRGYTLRPIRLG